MRIRSLVLATLALMMVAPSIAAYHGGWFGTGMGEAPSAMRPFNGAGAAETGNGWDAPIFRTFAFVNGTTTMYHVLSPEVFLSDHHVSRIYQFPACTSLDPVLSHHHPVPGDNGFWGEHDAPTREIVDVLLATGCAAQPKSEAEVQAMALPGAIVPRGLHVNAPKIPPQLADLPDNRLFNGPPFRPRIEAFQEGVGVKFITYEATWNPIWAPTKFAQLQDANVFMVSYGPMFRPGWTVLNVAAGSPLTTTASSYSPMWRANCVVDAINQKCMVSVNQPAGYRQCFSVDDCLTMRNSNTGLQVMQKSPNTFTHINCPMVSVDLDGDHYIGALEDLMFPNLWTNGPVIV